MRARWNDPRREYAGGSCRIAEGRGKLENASWKEHSLPVPRSVGSAAANAGSGLAASSPSVHARELLSVVNGIQAVVSTPLVTRGPV